MFPAVVILCVATVALSGRTHDVAPEYLRAEEPEIVAATFSAAWCAPCRILEPRLAGVIPRFADDPVKFVKLDFTRGPHEEVEALARREGLSDVYRRFGGASGFTLLVDRETGEVIDMLTIDHSDRAMRAAIAQAIAAAKQPGADAAQGPRAAN